MALNFSLNRTNLGIFQNIPNLKILILRIIPRKLQNSKKNSKNKTSLRIRMLVNTAPGVSIVCLLMIIYWLWSSWYYLDGCRILTLDQLATDGQIQDGRHMFRCFLLLHCNTRFALFLGGGWGGSIPLYIPLCHIHFPFVFSQ